MDGGGGKYGGDGQTFILKPAWVPKTCIEDVNNFPNTKLFVFHIVRSVKQDYSLLHFLCYKSSTSIPTSMIRLDDLSPFGQLLKPEETISRPKSLKNLATFWHFFIILIENCLGNFGQLFRDIVRLFTQTLKSLWSRPLFRLFYALGKMYWKVCLILPFCGGLQSVANLINILQS